jgi:hypothetical protein
MSQHGEQEKAMRAAQERADRTEQRVYVHVDSVTGKHFTSGMEYVGDACVFVGFAEPTVSPGPSAGAMRAAEKIHRGMFAPEIASLIDFESGLAEAREALREAMRALEAMGAHESRSVGWHAWYYGRKALARIEGREG